MSDLATTARKTLLVTFSVILLFAIGARAENESDFKIGTVLPLSGPLAEYGIAFKNGVTLAQQARPDIFESCTLSFEDSRYDPKTAITAFQKLTDLNHVQLVYNWGGPTSEALAPVAESRKVPLVVWSAEPQIARGKKYVFRFANSGADYGGALTRYLDKLGIKKLGIIRAENQYIDAILEGVRQKLAEGQTLEVIDSYPPADQDFRSTVAKLRTPKYDAIGVFLISGQVSQFYRQMVQQSIAIPTFGTDFFESMTEIKGANGGMNGAIYANNTISPSFRKAYVERFGNDLQITHAGNGYDWAILACESFDGKGSKTDAEEVLRILGKDAQHQGVQGSYGLLTNSDGDKYFRFPVIVKRIEGERIVDLPGTAY